MDHYLLPLTSSLFRIAAYLFLRVIPSRLLLPLLLCLYALHLLALAVFPAHDQPSNWHEKSPRPPKSRAHSPLSVLCFSLPSPSRFLTFANIAINSLLLLAAADFTFTPVFDHASHLVFSRVGAVYPDAVKILVRHPLTDNSSLSILYRESDSLSDDWKLGPALNLTHHSDWVDTVRLDNLWPGTSYEYVLAYSNKTLLPYPQHPISFRTFPDPRLNPPTHFRFLASSCVTPNFPYNGPLHKHSIPGFDYLADYLAASPAHPISNLSAPPPTEFLLFLGDFIYADVPIYAGDDQEAYRRLYRRNYQSPSFKKVYEQLPIFHAYDDHEFINNYVGNSQDIPPFANASSAYNIYAGNANYDPAVPGQNFYDFQYGDVAFFVLDTRRYRSPPTLTDDQTYRTMLGDEQLSALYHWLHKVNETASFKFVVSSVPFTSLWTHDAQIDSWAAYPAEKAALLEAFHSVPNVIIISGDRHEFAALEFPAADPAMHTVREFSTSPLSMFYIPFIHTLLPQSNATFATNITTVSPSEGSADLEQTQVEVQVPYEKTVAYIPHGNSKWSTFEIDTRDANKPTLRLETVIDGKPAYHLEIVGKPAIRAPQFTGLGSLVTTNVIDFFDKIGLKPAKWF